MKSSKISLMVIVFCLFTLIRLNPALSQQPSKDKTPPPEGPDVLVAAPAMAVPLPPPEAGANVMFGGGVGPGVMGVGTFHVAVGDAGLEIAAKPVKGSPYSAEATTEVVQTLSDGNRIQQKNSSMVYRDTEGRTRREHTVGNMIPLAAGDDPPQLIFINDPVAGVSYVLNPKERTAHKITLPPASKPSTIPAESGAATVKSAKEVTIERKVMTGGGEAQVFFENFRSPLQASPETERLGKRIIEGLEVEGTRSILTIPAGQIGNEQPIQIVSERWYSPELGTVILSKHSDPRFAETTYRLTGITRSEPAKSLFEIPSDYTVNDSGPSFPGIRYRTKIVKGND